MNRHTTNEEVSVRKIAAKKSKKPYVIVRTYSAGVFAGTLESRKGKEVVLSQARRLWYWSGGILTEPVVAGRREESWAMQIPLRGADRHPVGGH